MPYDLESVAARLRRAQRVVVFTGAGVSALKMRVMRACDRLRELLSDVRTGREVREEHGRPEVNDARHS